MKSRENILDEFYLSKTLISDLNIDINYINKKKLKELIHIFSKCDDFRKKYLVKFSYESMIMMIIISKICWKVEGFSEMAKWCKYHAKYLNELEIIPDLITPSYDTFRRFISLFNAESLQEETLYKIKDLFENISKKSEEYKTKIKMASVDGKELRATGRKENTLNPHSNLGTLNFVELSIGLCMVSKLIDKKQNEISALKELLPHLNLKGTILTADAIQCQRSICEDIISKGGNYLIACKSNQKELLDDQELCFYSLNEECNLSDSYLNKHIGKLITCERNNRRFRIIKLNKNYIGTSWPHVRSYIEIESKTHDKKNYSLKRYFISSLINEELIYEAIENRWTIEGDYHYEKDTLLYEDSFKCENRNAVKNMAVINSIILGFFKVTKMLYNLSSSKEAKLKIASNPNEEIANILSVINSDKLLKEINKQMRIKRKLNK